MVQSNFYYTHYEGCMCKCQEAATLGYLDTLSKDTFQNHQLFQFLLRDPGNKQNYDSMVHAHLLQKPTLTAIGIAPSWSCFEIIVYTTPPT